jgi:hypothetical protein
MSESGLPIRTSFQAINETFKEEIMKPQNRSTKLFTMVIALAALATVWSILPARRMSAIGDVNDKTSPIGIASGQVARLTVLNRGDVRGFEWCRARFLDSDGNVLVEFIREPVVVASGQMISFDLDGDSLEKLRDAFGRVQIRAEVTASGAASSGVPSTGLFSRESLRVTVEVFNKADGKTVVFIGDPNV